MDSYLTEEHINLKTPIINESGVDKRLWFIELRLLKMLHDFCKDKGIPCYLAAGTALGAKRHGGFIPWDDDVDVIIPREDYDRLLTLAEEFPEPFKLVWYGNTPGYQYQWAKLEYTRSEVIEFNYPKGRHGGVYIDVFPLDGYPDSEKERRKRMNRNIWWKIKSNALHGYHTGIWYLKWFWPFLGFFMRIRYKNTADFHRAWDERFAAPYYTSTYHADQFGADMSEVMENRIIGKPTPIEFEGLEFYGPESIEEYLTCVYGNWEALPPEDKRKAAHGYSFSLFDDIL